METQMKTREDKIEAQKAAVARAVTKVVDETRSKIGEKSIVEALVSDVSNVSSMLDKRFIGRLIVGRDSWSQGDLLVAGVALRLSHKKEDCADVAELVSFVHGKQRAQLCAALTGTWKDGSPFRLNAQSATEVLAALSAAQHGAIRKAKSEIARLQALGVDLFLAAWSEALADSARREVEVFTSAVNGVWATSGKKFFWNETSAFKVIKAASKLDSIWATAVECGAA